MLTGESRFHISTPLGIEPGSLMTGSKRNRFPTRRGGFCTPRNRRRHHRVPRSGTRPSTGTATEVRPLTSSPSSLGQSSGAALWRACNLTAFIHSSTGPLVQWSTCLLSVMRDRGSIPWGVLMWNQESPVSVVSLQYCFRYVYDGVNFVPCGVLYGLTFISSGTESDSAVCPTPRNQTGHCASELRSQDRCN